MVVVIYSILILLRRRVLYEDIEKWLIFKVKIIGFFLY